MRHVGLALLFALAPFALRAAPAAPDVDAYQRVLSTHVLPNGTVRYAALKANLAPLEGYVQQLAAVSPDSHPALFPTPSHRLAHWINAYNALVLWSFAKDYPDSRTRLGSLLGRANYFFRRKFTVGGRQRSLDDIETNSIRSAGDPRIHCAIVCASTSCPWLSAEVYRPERLDAQLDRAARQFFGQERNVRLDAAANTATVSQIFDWFRKDFGPDADAVKRFIGRYHPAGAAAWARPGLKLQYAKYDWSLNDATPPPR